MKKFLALLCCVVLVFTLCLSGSAAQTVPNRVYAAAVTASAGETVIIPVCISGNTGFMGFAILVDYDAAVLTPVSAAKSQQLSGMFDDSIETAQAGSFKVVYTDSSNVTADGTLFELTFLVDAGFEAATVIHLSYSQEDTFNENWQNAVLHCEDITLSPQSMPVPPEKPDEKPKLSERISSRVAQLQAPWSGIVSVLLAPLVFVLRLIGQ